MFDLTMIRSASRTGHYLGASHFDSGLLLIKNACVSYELFAFPFTLLIQEITHMLVVMEPLHFILVKNM